MKRVLLVVLCLAMTLALASCEQLQSIFGGEEQKECAHTYSDVWSNDANNHWYEATCECEGEVANLAAHADTNKDGKCDVCKYEMCAHTYAETYTKDASGHWYAATCGCEVKKDFAAHTDANKDGICDTCEYVVCAHTYADTYTKDANGHWYAATCGCDVKSGYALHADEGEIKDGLCDACKYVISDADFVAAVIAGLDSEAYASVNNATIKQDKIQQGIGYDGEEYKYEYTYDSFVKIYNDYVVVKNGNYGSTYYYSYYTNNANKNGVFLVIVSDYGDVSRNIEAEEYDGSIYNFQLLNYSANSNTTEGILAKLYEMASGENAYALEQTFDDATAAYTFTFYYVEINEYDDDYIHDVSVSFKLNSEYNAVSELNVTYKSYEYNSEWVVDGVCTIPADATYTVFEEYAVTQSFGAPMTGVENPYPASNYIVNGYNVTVGENTYVDGNTVNMTAGYDNQIYLYIGNVDASKIPFNAFDAIATDAEGNELDYGYISVYTDSESGAVSVTGYKAGTYLVTVNVEGEELTLTINVEWATPTEISSQIYADDYYQTMDSFDTFVGVGVQVKGFVTSGSNPAYTAVVTQGQDTALLVLNEDGSYTFKAVMAGEYKITFTSAVATDVTAVLTITVSAPPSVSDILSGSYKTTVMGWNTIGYGVVFTPDSDGATTGTLVLTVEEVGFDYSTWTEITTTYTETLSYTYDSATGALTLTHVSGDEIQPNIYIENYVLCVQYGYNEPAAMEKIVIDNIPTFEAGATSITVTITETYAYEDAYVYVADEAGTYTFVLPYGELGMWIDGYNNPNSDWQMSAEFDYTNEVVVVLAAGESIKFTVSAATKGEWTITVEYEAEGTGNVPGGDTGSTENAITGDGSEETPYVVSGAGSVLISAGKWSPVFVTVKAGVTVTLDCAAQFYTDPTDTSTGVGKTVSPTEDTTYYIYADTMAGCMGQMTATVVGGSTGDAQEDGTAENPYILTGESASGEANYQGWLVGFVWYKLTLTTGGNVTVSSSFTGTPWLVMGKDPYAPNVSNEGASNSITAYYPAGTSVYIGIADWDEAADVVPFAVSFEAVVSDDLSAVAGTWSGNGNTMWGACSYTVTINTDGTGTVAYADDYETSVYAISYVLLLDGAITIVFANEYSEFSIVGTVDGNTINVTKGMSYETLTLTKN